MEVRRIVAPRHSPLVMFLNWRLSEKLKVRKFNIGGRICGDAEMDVNERVMEETLDKFVIGEILVMKGKPIISTVWS